MEQKNVHRRGTQIGAATLTRSTTSFSAARRHCRDTVCKAGAEAAAAALGVSQAAHPDQFHVHRLATTRTRHLLLIRDDVLAAGAVEKKSSLASALDPDGRCHFRLRLARRTTAYTQPRGGFQPSRATRPVPPSRRPAWTAKNAFPYFMGNRGQGYNGTYIPHVI